MSGCRPAHPECMRPEHMRLATLLDAHDLPVAELSALRLDGQTYAIDEQFSPIDQPECEAQRCAAFAALAPAGAVAEADSAFWIYGIRSDPPARHTAVVPLTASTPAPLGGRMHLRQVSLPACDIRAVGPGLVLTPLRLLLDLARLSEEWSNLQQNRAAALIRLGGIRPSSWLCRLNEPHHLPFKQRAMIRIAGAQALVAQPAVTR